MVLTAFSLEKFDVLALPDLKIYISLAGNKSTIFMIVVHEIYNHKLDWNTN